MTLLERLRDGDGAAFATLVDGNAASMLRVARMHVASEAVAQEVVQETWLAVLQGLDRFEERSSLRTWIFQILLNTARTRGVREKRTLPFSYFKRRAEEGRDEPAVDADRFQGRDGVRPGWWARPPVEWEGADARVESDEVRDLLLEAIAELPPRQREVIVLRDLQGYSSEEDDGVSTLEGDLVDLEPLLRDAVVLALPFQPLCMEDCPGLCPDCGFRLADDPDHAHDAAIDPRWAGLTALQQDQD